MDKINILSDRRCVTNTEQTCSIIMISYEMLIHARLPHQMTSQHRHHPPLHDPNSVSRLDCVTLSGATYPSAEMLSGTDSGR